MAKSSNRDEFKDKTKKALAFRANHRCSFTDCGTPTCGPSEESPSSIVTIGIASHIHAAALGGPRYIETMTSEEREDISNGIWLCPTHSTLIDRDRTTYTPNVLRNMKLAHECRIFNELTGTKKSLLYLDFVAIGPYLVFTGELIGVDSNEWRLQIHHFLIGDIYTLITFSENFEKLSPNERYILVNSLGDGRQLECAPTWQKSDSGYIVSCKVHNSFPRLDAYLLPEEWALNDDHDIFAVNGKWAKVSGVDALHQRIKCCLSLQRGESPFYPDLGARIKEYFELFMDTPLLSRLVKLEVIRHACVPYSDPLLKTEYTLLMSVLRVRIVEMLRYDGQKRKWQPFHFELDIEGVGPWQHDIPILIPLRPERCQIER